MRHPLGHIMWKRGARYGAKAPRPKRRIFGIVCWFIGHDAACSVCGTCMRCYGATPRGPERAR